ncbi:ComF family protein|uniref:ComF family protein n=1 Tax=Dendrosporobacter quercicolus TaxID=146817 RepID=A0A1G9WT57_9FIRM|nr:double zinc ribbon domain-containing protein [Dendrosporobacter quercicolus]NSL49205.1 ComF family protein [Dendrosporobacter quercicolus DSM 1736]SDM87607.1 comF family protein [Dendrosporobacter quercicolus]
MLDWLWSTLLDCLYPPKCPVCRTGVARHGAWCSPCAGQVLAVREINVVQHRLRYLDSCLVLCEYRGAVKKILYDIKFNGSLKYARHLAWLLDCYADPVRLGRIDRVIPVPLHSNRRKERGYNQTEQIYRNWVRENGWNWSAAALSRSKSTAPLWGLPLQERRRAVKTAFQVSDDQAVSGAAVLLVDDIFTSGATMEECAKTLKQAGACCVRGLAIAGGTGDHLPQQCFRDKTQSD